MANFNLLLIVANMIVYVLSKGKVARMSTIPLAHAGTPSCYPAATHYTATCGVAAITATSEFINSLAACFLSAFNPFYTMPSNIYICNIAAYSIRRAPLAPCYATVCPDDATLAAGIYCTIAALPQLDVATWAANCTSAARPRLKPISTNLHYMAVIMSAFKPDS